MNVHTRRPEPTAIYDVRASALDGASLSDLYAEFRKLPFVPMRYPLSEPNLLRLQLCTYVIGIIRATKDIGLATRQSWLSGQFLAASVLIRLFIEMWGALAYAEQRVLRKLEANEFEVARARMDKLLLGSNTGVTHIPGRMVKVAPTNVMEFVRAADVDAVGMASEYKFLCDAAHPTFHPSFHLLLAGAMYDNWTNDTFARAMHPVLDRTLKAAEAALGGIERVGSDIAARCLPPIGQEVSTWPLEA